MKKILYITAVLVALSTFKSNAQYHITSHSWHSRLDGVCDPTVFLALGLTIVDTAWFCNVPYLVLTTDGYDTDLTVKSYFGEGSCYTQSVVDSGTFGYLRTGYLYYLPGVYSIKQVLCLHGMPIDSISGYFEHHNCGEVTNMPYLDLSGTGHFVPGTDVPLNAPMQFSVDSDGIVIDTVLSTAVFNHNNWGNATPGTIYGFRELPQPGFIITSPAIGANYDTIATTDQQFVNYTGNACSSIAGFDLALCSSTISGRDRAKLQITVDNPSCNAEDETVTLNFSSKYYFGTAYPMPTSVVGNTATWFFPAGFAYSSNNIDVVLFHFGTYITVGDTLHYDINVTPIAGDTNPANNYMVIIDTCKGSWDPNEMSVTPEGTITPGTQLQYTIDFENTGNDTAFNISVYDTLSDNVDIHSLKFVAASNYVTTSVTHLNGQNILKFDFPLINLLDSSHHNQCDGMVIFTINTKSGLPDGTKIFNRAGIYFDDNPVVMTNTVEDIIGVPTMQSPVMTLSKVSVYPNPANDEVTISTDNTDYITATFTNVVGQQVLVQSLAPRQTKVNVSRLAPGMYYITLRGEGGVKLVKFEKR